MNTCLKSILNQNGISPNNTPYSSVCDYAVNMGNFFGLSPFRDYHERFAFFSEYEPILSQMISELQERLFQVNDSILKLKKDKHGWHVPELHRLRGEKKSIADSIQVKKRDFFESLPQKYVVVYKNTLTADTFENVSAFIPALRNVRCERLWKMPVFTRNVEKLSDCDLSKAGVVGGPCLFGTDEVIVIVTHSNNEKYCFDFNTGRNHQGNNAECMGSHLLNFGEKITDVSFVNRKKRITLQEYESLAYPMEIASALNASFLYPIPDMSYRKYLESVAENLRHDVRIRAVERFSLITGKIADMHIELFYELLQKYKIRRYLLLHERNKEALDFFYNSRRRFFNDSRFARRKAGFSAKTGKNESVCDYISVLAAPYYFWGTKHIIQCDVTDETDSMSKCAKIHKNEFVLAGIMYPEILSKNGVDVIFNAPEEYKIYYEKVTENNFVGSFSPDSRIFTGELSRA